MSYAPKHPVAWSEIPVSDLDKAVAYYSAVIGGTMQIQEMGPNKTALFAQENGPNTAGAHLYPGKPPARGTGPTVHLNIPGTLEEASERVTAAGGEVVSPPVEIPEGRFLYTLDPDGNSIGLFELS